MITVAEAELIIQKQAKDFGDEMIAFDRATGRVLAENIAADRDMPPYDRITMDGIAIRYDDFKNGQRSFKKKGIQAAGDNPVEITADECVEIMTGAALPPTADTIVRYEDLDIKEGVVTIKIETLTKGQFIHYKGMDRKEGEVVIAAGQLVNPAVISIAATVGKAQLSVKKLPKVIIISTGDELTEVSEQPQPYQIRRSNSYTIKAVLQQYGIAADIIHIPDDAGKTKQQLAVCLERYDVLILSGGISMGKFDYVPQALEDLSVTKLFHKVQQRPGKPFWFGAKGDKLVFAFPGNPVSAFMCLHRYFLPWLNTSLGIRQRKMFAMLDKDFTFQPSLQYFLQVKLAINEQAQLLATPAMGNGSGDFANLVDTDAFMELPLEQSNFKKGEAFPVWPFKQILT